MNANEPLVTVIVPTYNRAQLIQEAIRSVIDQTYTHWELIVADDGSTDDTEKIVTSLGDVRISYHFFSHTGVIDTLRNFGMRKSKGELVAFLDADDLWHPNKLETQIRLLAKNPDASFAFTHGYEFNSIARNFHDTVFHRRNCATDDVFIGNVFTMLLDGEYMLYTSSLIFRKTAIEKIGWMDETLKSCFGYEYFLRLAADSDGIAVNQKLISVRKHDQNISIAREHLSYDTSASIIQKYYATGHIPAKQYRKIISEFHYQAGLIQLKTRNRRKAAGYFQRYLFLKPFRIQGWVRLLQSLFGNYTFKI